MRPRKWNGQKKQIRGKQGVRKRLVRCRRTTLDVADNGSEMRTARFETRIVKDGGSGNMCTTGMISSAAESSLGETS
jgi:hypothetical protein